MTRCRANYPKMQKQCYVICEWLPRITFWNARMCKNMKACADHLTIRESCKSLHQLHLSLATDNDRCQQYSPYQLMNTLSVKRYECSKWGLIRSRLVRNLAGRPCCRCMRLSWTTHILSTSRVGWHVAWLLSKGTCHRYTPQSSPSSTSPSSSSIS